MKIDSSKSCGVFLLILSKNVTILKNKKYTSNLLTNKQTKKTKKQTNYGFINIH